VICKEHEKAGDRVRREIREMGEKEDKLMRERANEEESTERAK
jgi:hypothetical protein